MKKILFVGSEVMPFAATGGLGDVLGSLPPSLAELGGSEVELSVIMPLYSAISDDWQKKMKREMIFDVYLSWRKLYCGIFSLVKDNVKYYFVDNEYYFKRDRIYGEFDDGERYAFFCMAVMEFLRVSDYKPDVLHAHDWQGALCLVYYDRKYRKCKGLEKLSTVFTIHNIEYQGKFDFSILGDVFSLTPNDRGIVEYDNCINLMKAAIECAGKVTTVSPRYASEILGEEHSHGLYSILGKYSYKLCGILNGIDYKYYDPRRDRALVKTYGKSTALQGKSENKTALQNYLALPERNDAPLLVIISRLAFHKGLDLVLDIADRLMQCELQFIVLGRGSARYENYFRELEGRYPDKMRAILNYDRDLAKRLYAAADIFVMPSKSEPCGLSQMIASRYGAIPIVHAVGGLYDSIKSFHCDGAELNGNGFAFPNYSSEELLESIFSAISALKDEKMRKKMVEKIMSADFSFAASAEKYLGLYREIWG